jgi:phosphoglycerate dehydrogenase-like enzyme
MSSTVLICYPDLAEVVDEAEFHARFPNCKLKKLAYEISHKLQTDRVADPNGSLANEPPLSAEQAAAFAEAEIVVTLDAPRNLPAVAPNLRWIQTIGSGIAQFGVTGAARGGITLTNAAGIAASPISEWVVARIFQLIKRLDVHAEQQREHVWQPVYGTQIIGKTVVVVGLGAIGKEVAWRCGALGMKVIGVRRTPCAPGEEPEGVNEVATPDDLTTFVAGADVVVSAVPAGPDTHNLYGAAMFDAMGPNCIFLNVGRGTAVDEDALVAALRGGRLRAAALDVTRQEPLPADSPLWDVPNLHISPHSSPSPDGYMDRLWVLFLDNLAAYRAGQPLRNKVEPPHEPALAD